jgi:hypothetical protein
MSFAIVSTPEADQELARYWITAKDRNAVTESQNRIEKLLAREPRRSGHEVSEGLWKIEIPPLIAYYEIDDLKNEVTLTGFAFIP